MSHTEGFNPATRTYFRLGDWVEWDDNFGRHVGRIDPPHGSAEASVTYSVGDRWGHSFGWQPGHQPDNFRKWQAKPGERVRVTKNSFYPKTIGKVVTVEGGVGYRFRAGDERWHVLQGVVEFEPVFEEAEKRESDKSRDSGHSGDCPPSGGHTRHCPPASFNGIEFPPPRRITQQERTHYDRKPRAKREAVRKRMAMEVLTARWAGRKDRA